MIKAKFNNKTKQEILDRDICCIICGKPGTDCHHSKFGVQSNYGKDRNDAKEGCLLCRDCHNSCHSSASGTGVREKCIQYLNKLYEM